MNSNLAKVGKPTRWPPGKSGNPAGKPGWKTARHKATHAPADEPRGPRQGLPRHVAMLPLKSILPASL